MQRQWEAREKAREDMMDFRFGKLMALIANIKRDPRRTPPYRAGDFYPSLLPPPPGPEEMEAKLDAAFGV